MRKGIIALSPLLVFIVLYLVTSIIARDFYKVPITVAFMVASIYAVTTSGGIPLRKRIDIYSRGAGTSQMMLMIWIFILAGSFANTAKTMGAIDATVNLTLTLLPANMLLAGLFILFYLYLHWHQCRYYRGTNTYRSRYCQSYGNGVADDCSDCGRRLFLW